MDQDLDVGQLEPVTPSKKFRQASYGFMGLSVLYLLIAMIFLPPFNFGVSTVLYITSFVLVILILTILIYRGKKLLVQILAVIYGARSAFTLYSLISGDTFVAVPYLLSCLLLTFYILGRAAWNWP